MIRLKKVIINRIKFLQCFASALILQILIVGIFIVMPSALYAKETRHHQLSSANHAKAIKGIASFYSTKFNGKRTANGEKFNNNALTAAHKTLPFGSQIKVTNLKNGLSVIVRINDRGPYVRGRIIDLSKAAAKKIGFGRSGTLRVKLEVLNK